MTHRITLGDTHIIPKLANRPLVGHRSHLASSVAAHGEAELLNVAASAMGNKWPNSAGRQGAVFAPEPVLRV
jgi:hypothetical protein